MAVVAGGVNFCSIARDFGIPADLLPFTGIFETILEGDSFSIFYLSSMGRETSGTEISIFPNSLFQITKIRIQNVIKGSSYRY